MNEQEIFQAALDQEEQQREGFLDTACGRDLELRRRVERLLRLHHQAGEFFEKPAAEIVDVELPDTEQIGAFVGPYKLRERLAEGGMGVVYVAEQTDPVRRKVALKIIKPGLATKDVVMRFEVERQALALMDHPNIARIFDAGTTDAGQPFFVMELVQGVPVTEYCDQHELTTRERLQLFTQVCRAVQHAHQKGVIHRDIKPSNVLVAAIDGSAVPKVIDFGVAKAVGQKLTEETVYTQFSQMIGTPLYMSPEQADMGVLDVDTRSDIYSLGVLLYELLTGSTPFDRETLKRAGFDEWRRIIREEEPPRPSAAVSTLQAQNASTVAAQRHSDPRRLCQALKGELDWIVMKALEKDRSRRYESVSAFSLDLQHHLDGAPVEACPPSIAYRIRKTFSQHRALFTVAAAVLMALSIGLGIASWQAVLAHQIAGRERQSRQQAQANLQLAIDAVADMYDGLATGWLASDQALTLLQATYSQKAVDFYSRLLDHPGQYDLSAQQAAEMGWRAALLLQKMSEDVEASARLKTATDRFTATFDGREQLASDASLALLADMLNLSGSLADELGDRVKAKQAFAEADAVCEQLARRPSAENAARIKQAFVANNLYGLHIGDGELELADRALRRALDVFDQLGPKAFADAGFIFDSLRFPGNQSALLLRQGKGAKAEKVASEALARVRKRLVGSPDDRRGREVEAFLMTRLACTLVDREKFDQADTLLAELMRRQVARMSITTDPSLYTYSLIFGGTPDRFPGFDEPKKWSDWIRSSVMLAEVKYELGQPIAAEVLLGRANFTAKYLYILRPQRVRHLIDRANVSATTAWILRSRFPEQAKWYANDAATVWQENLAKFPFLETELSEMRPGHSDFQWFIERFPDDDFRQADFANRPDDRGVQGWLHLRARQLVSIDFGEPSVEGLTAVLKQQASPEPYDLLTLSFALAQTGRLEEARKRYQHAMELLGSESDSSPEPIVAARRKQVAALLEGEE